MAKRRNGGELTVLRDNEKSGEASRKVEDSKEGAPFTVSDEGGVEKGRNRAEKRKCFSGKAVGTKRLAGGRGWRPLYSPPKEIIGCQTVLEPKKRGIQGLAIKIEERDLRWKLSEKKKRLMGGGPVNRARFTWKGRLHRGL